MPTTINGTSGNDTLVGTSGDDIINGLAGNDTLTGGDGNDILVGGTGDDYLDGGAGRDLADFQSSPTPVYVALFATRPQYGDGQDTLVSIEDVRGSAFDDQILGDGGDNHLMGMAGNDILYGGGGVDLLEGGLGDDLYFFNDGDQTGPEINDSGGYDRIRFSANSAYVFVVSAGDIGVDRVEIGAGMDLGPSSGMFTEGLGIDARAAANGLMIVGSDRANSLWGTAFADVIEGRLGEDRLSGGLGNDILSGGDGKDVFVDTAAGLNGDTITDLAIGETIIITDANVASFSYSLVGHTLTYTGGSLTLGSLAVGRLIASAAPGGGVQLLLGPAIIPVWPSPPGPENFGQTIDQSSTFTVAAGNYYYSIAHPGSGDIPIGSRDSVLNRGSIFLEGAVDFYGVLIFASYPGVRNIDNSGTIVFNNHGSFAHVDMFRNSHYINNSGQIYAISETGYARFLQTWDSSAQVINSGLIAVYAPTNDGTRTAGGMFFANGGTVVNTATGRILVEGASAFAMSINSYAFSSDGSNPAELTNAGLIEARSTGGIGSMAVGLSFGEVINTGTITGDIAVYLNGTLTNSGTINGNVQSPSFFTLENQAAGILNGDIIGGDSDGSIPSIVDHINNAGLINGNVDLQRGDDTFVNIGAGRVTGIVALGYGQDQYTGSASVDRVNGDHGNDIIDGAGGNDLLLGGFGNDLLIGGAGNDGLFGELGDDTIRTQGGDIVSGGAGNDRIQLGDYTFRSIDGGTGHDVLLMASGARNLDLSAALGSGRLAGIDEIELVGSQQLVVRPNDVAALSSGGTRLVVSTTASDSVSLVGAWAEGAAVTFNGSAYRVFTSNGATVLVDQVATIGIGASAPGGAIGLDSIATGDVALIPGTTSGMAFTATDYQLSWYELRTNMTVEAEESWFAYDGDSAVWSEVGPMVFTVDGRLSAYNDIGASGIAINFSNGASLTNNGIISVESIGPIRPNAPWMPYSEGVSAYSYGSISNNGLIDSYSLNGVANGVGRVTIFPADSWPERYTVIDGSYGTNNGTIQAWSERSFAFGFSGLLQTNSGTIRAHGATGAVAVFTSAGFDYTLRNLASGTISAEAPDGRAEIGILLYGNGVNTVVNDGIIDARHAIEVRDSSDGLFVTNSGQILGDIYFAPFFGPFYPTFLNLINSAMLNGNVFIGDDVVPLMRSISWNGSTRSVNDLILNSGTIEGNISMASGADIYDGRGGRVGGLVDGGSGNDTLVGGSFADRLIGGADDDGLTGGLGADFLTGGNGNDLFSDTRAGLSGDTITDFAIGDRIVITDATLAGFTFSLAGNTLTYSGGTLTLAGGVAGRLVASAATGGGVQITIAPVADVANDFNGDGRSDILWRSTTGQLSDWLG